MRIISRDEWGAQHARGFRAAPLPARELYLHHTATTPAATIRTIENIGESRFGGGISYTFCIDPAGHIYEGHGIERQGAHTGGRNSISRSICWIGNYDTTRPTEAMVDATIWLVRHGHESGWWPNRFTGGHQDAPGASTACPGRFAMQLLDEINRAAQERDDDMTPEQAKMLADIHREHTVRYDYRNHHMSPVDNVYGHTMSIRKDADAYAHRDDVGLVRDLVVALRAELEEVTGAAALEKMAVAMEKLADAIIQGGTK